MERPSDPDRNDPFNTRAIDDRAQQDARKTAALIVSEIEAGGAAPNALKHLGENVQSSLESFAQEAQANPNERDPHGTSRQSAFRSAYMQELGKELLKKGVLPELAVAHGLNVIDADGTGITRSELEERRRQIGPWTSNYKRNNELDFMFTQTLADLYHEIRLQHADIVGKKPIIGGGHESNEITRADLETFLSRARVRTSADAQTATIEQIANFDIAAVLLKKANSSYPGSGRFDSLENHEGHYDGKLSRDDLRSYLRMGDNNDSIGRVIKFLYENWDSAQVKLMREGDFITRDGLVRGTGYPNMTELRTEIWRRQFVREEGEERGSQHRRELDRRNPYGDPYWHPRR